MIQDNSRGLYQLVELNVYSSTAKTTSNMLQCLSKPIFEKHNFIDLIAHLRDIPDIIREVQHHLSLSQNS